MTVEKTMLGIHSIQGFKEVILPFASGIAILNPGTMKNNPSTSNSPFSFLCGLKA